MKLKLWQVDAFTDKVLGGNPAAVVPFDAWLDDALLQAIAAENNLAETAFFVKTAPGAYHLRWFTPTSEVESVRARDLGQRGDDFPFPRYRLAGGVFPDPVRRIEGYARDRGANRMSMPSAKSEPFTPPHGFADALAAALGAPGPQELHYASKGGAGAGALIAVWPSPDAVKALNPNGDLEAVLLRVKAGRWWRPRRATASPMISSRASSRRIWAFRKIRLPARRIPLSLRSGRSAWAASS